MAPHPSSRHMHTEKRRRDRIALGFDTLRSLVPTADSRADKATFLQQVVQYIQQAQETIHEAANCGGMDAFSEETRWQIRMLIPKLRPEASASPQPFPQASEQPFRPQAQPASQALPLLGTQEGVAPALNTPGRGSLSGLLAAGRSQDLDQSAFQPAKRRKEAASEGVREGEDQTQQVQQLLQQASAQGVVQASGSQDAEGGRVAQLQQLLMQLQAQQAATAQQLQLQQAALMRNQVVSAMSLNQLLQRNLQGQNSGSQEGGQRQPSQALPQGLAQGVSNQWPGSTQASPGILEGKVAHQADTPSEDRTASGDSQQASESNKVGHSKPPRRMEKVRSHTTVGQYSAQGEGMPQGSPLTGRPDRSGSGSGGQNSQ